MSDYDFLLNDDESSPDIAFIRKELDNYNNRFAEPYHHRKLNVIIKKDNETIGGLVGGTYWGWLYIDRFWINDKYRKAGLGSRILKMAEEEARQRGCRYAHLDTHDFQAVGFYKKNGYEIVSRLENLPEGFNRYLMKKALL